MEDAEIALVSYGVSGRTAPAAVDMARKQGIKAGLLRLTVWPFPEALIRSLALRVRLVTVEINLGRSIWWNGALPEGPRHFWRGMRAER